jgi:hypothetical protein
MRNETVLQGPVIGPLFFITYISDLPPAIHTLGNHIVFADDTNVTLSPKKLSALCRI